MKYDFVLTEVGILYKSSIDFFEKASQLRRLSRDEEKECARLMKNGDVEARLKIIDSYIPYVASFVKRTSEPMQSLELIYRCLYTLEKQVDVFDFQVDGEPFVRRLGRVLRMVLTRYIAEKQLIY